METGNASTSKNVTSRPIWGKSNEDNNHKSSIIAICFYIHIIFLNKFNLGQNCIYIVAMWSRNTFYL